MNLSIGLQQVALRQPDHPAILWEGAQLNYAGFADQVSRIAGGLRDRHGLQPGARVAMAMVNSPEFLPVMFGIWRAGMVAVPINAKLHPREMSWIFQNSGARLVIASPGIAQALEANLTVISTAGVDYAALLASDPVARVESAPDDPAWIFYTSGTTGRPKGAVLTYRNLLAMSHAYYADCDFVGPQDVRLHAAPMSHGSGIYALPFVLKGAQNLIHGHGFDPASVYDVLTEHRNVSFFAAPTMVTRLTAHGRSSCDVSGLKTLEYGGAPMYVADCRRALEIFGDRLYQLYGQGEAPMTISNVTKAMHVEATDELLGSAGCARTGCEIAILDGWEPQRPGTVGEIATRSDCVMSGYLGNTDATDAALRDGWLRTGDVGVIDAAGILTLKDRSKDMIISGGSNIYPREIEEVLLTAPEVRETAVVGAPHPDWGEEVVAFVVSELGASLAPETLDRLCLENLARFKRPKRYEFVDALPKNNYGKVVKTELRSLLGSRQS
ncbi:MAG: AMP-binding protein [Pseudomonadota bacterium]